MWCLGSGAPKLSANKHNDEDIVEWQAERRLLILNELYL